MSDKSATSLCPVCQFKLIRRGRTRCRYCKIAANKPPTDPAVYVIEGVECRRLPLTHCQYALVNAIDYLSLSQGNWSARWAKTTQSWYAVRCVRRGKDTRTIYLHKVIAGSDALNDHANGDSLDCRRANLRPASRLENGQNKKRRSDNTSGYIGVHLHKPGIWRARGMSKVERKSLGLYTDPITAAQAYDAWALATYGAFARLNFPLEVAA